MDNSTVDSMCRCCASEGIFKDMKSSYHWMGEDEIYGEMLSECFDVKLATLEEGGICEVCITQLRNAANFKKQVLHTEIRFKRHLENRQFQPTEVKEELSGDNGNSSDDNDLGGGDGSDDDDDYVPEFEIPIKTESADESKTRKRSAKATTSSTRAKRTRLADAEKRTDDDALKSKRKKKKSDISATPERVEHRVNLTVILQNSNATPFKDKTARGFSCLYCDKYFPSIHDLRVHTALRSEKDKLNTILDYKLSYNPIKIDITNLQCSICGVSLPDLNCLKDHLTKIHNKKMYRDIKDIILPFRLGNGTSFNCVICSMMHVSFKNLYHHMSTHYSNYCCTKCGVGYITIAALRKHGRTHAQGIFPCSFCNKTFNTLVKRRNHERGVHTSGWLRNKCPHCPEVFVGYYERSEHLVEVHNAERVTHPCNACNKVYKKKYELNRHIKHHHLQQKSFRCDICNNRFYSKRGLADHLIRHTGGDLASCDICGKTFSRTRSLKEHLKMHDAGSRYQCEVCHKVFMQKCSLKNHMRLHQDDLDIFKEFDDVKHLIDDRVMTLKQIADENKKKSQAEKQGPHFLSL